MKHMQSIATLAEQHYAEHASKPFFGELVDFITGGPLVALVLEGHEAVAPARQVIGATNPLEAAPGSIRGDFGLEVQTNLVHGSDSPESAARETALFFPSSQMPEPLVLAPARRSGRRSSSSSGSSSGSCRRTSRRSRRASRASSVIENARRKARAVEGDARPRRGHRGRPRRARSSASRRPRPRPRTFLRRLSGRTHEVMSGIALRDGRGERSDVAVTRVRFRRSSRLRSTGTSPPASGASGPGGYAIQGRGRGARGGDRGRLLERRRAAGCGPPAACPGSAPPSLDFRPPWPGAARRLVHFREAPARMRAAAPALILTPTTANGLLLVPHRHGRPRHGGRPRDREHARLRARPRHRALRAVRRGDRLAHQRGPRGRDRGQADARPHARHDPGDPAAQGRRDRRLRRDRADAAPLHPEGAPEPLGASARGGLRALRRDRGREAGGRGGLPVAPARARPT